MGWTAALAVLPRYSAAKREGEKERFGIWQRIWKATREDEDDEDDDDDEEYDDDEKEANRVHGLARSARRSHDDADMT